MIRTNRCAYQGVRNVGFSENFAYILIEWSLTLDLPIEGSMKYPLKYALQPVPEKNSGQTEFFSGTGYINFVSSKLKSDESDFWKKKKFFKTWFQVLWEIDA